ncbi:glycosyltransferase family 2 protein [Clostridium sp. C8]|uniref:glycosyltransferase family 2 protein n=1 Tax=Clostridium sp. C8 TaxID=1667357 RepID=UPI00062E5618|nr:glycosyltransferase family 2 protein [Clostridium sp. C8]KLE14597.1 hypothetical protein AAT22_15815 [Clostridium sp. C8]
MNENSCCCIIVTYDIGENLEKCFLSIKDQVKEIVIIDNGSNEETIQYLRYLSEKNSIKVIFNEENMGIAYALNQGVKYAKEKKYDWIITMDNDSEAVEDMVSVMLNTYNSLDITEKQRIAGIFPEKIEKGLTNSRDYKKVNNYDDYIYITHDITSGNLIKTKIFDEIGLFDEKLFIDSVDHELCYRILNMGYTMIKVRNSILLHSLGKTKQKKILFKNVIYTNHSALRKYYMTRNRFYIWQKYKNLKEINKLDKKNFIKENIKILLLEEDKIDKFKMILRGYIDYRNNRFGKKS